MLNKCLNDNINIISSLIGSESAVVVKKLYIGGSNALEGAIIYIEALVNKESISRDILKPLMLYSEDNFEINDDFCQYISKRYITTVKAGIEKDLTIIADALKSGNTIIVVDGFEEVIVSDTKGGEYRAITDPLNESSIKGNREGFVERLETNIAFIRRSIKDSNLKVEYLKVGRRSQTQLALLYIEDIVDKDVLEEVRARIAAIDVDSINDSGMLHQYIEDYPYSPFPQVYGTERSDRVTANIMEGRIGIILNNCSYVLTAPAVFTEFFHAVDDYNERILNASFARLLRYITAFVILTLPAIYLTIIEYNVELIPVKLIVPIVESRKGIYLTPFLEIMLMEIVVEFLREGGLRLPPKIASTLSIVGGIIIGNTAVESKIVSPLTLLVVGFTTIATFLIQNYEMSLSIRLIRFPILILANFLGFLGITIAWFVILVHLCKLESFKVQYFDIKRGDLKDTFIRGQLWKMDKRPEAIPNNNGTRQKDFRGIFRRRKNG